MNKEIALVFEYDKAPKELKEAAKAFNEAQKAVAKTQVKVNAIAEELVSAVSNQEAAEKTFRIALKSWTPGT